MTPAGLLHSEICGSQPTYGSPQLIAVNRVLLRLLVPRHSPCALCSLTMCSRFALNKLNLPFRNCSYYPKQIVSTLFLVITLDFCLLPLSSFQSTVAFRLVGSSGLEPPTSRLSGVCSNLLSYEPKLISRSEINLLCFASSTSYSISLRETANTFELFRLAVSAFCLSCPWWR